MLERLAVLTPRPRVNLLLFHGVLGPRAARRAQVVSFGRAATSADTREDAGDGSAGTAADARPTAAGLRWAELLRHAFGFDVLACPCGGRLRLVALIEEASVIRRI